MAQVVILGGYGRVGGPCALEIAAQTSARLLIAGPNIQRAESAALALGTRAAAAYGNATDPRALARLLEGSALLVACCSGLPVAALELAIGMRVPVIAVSSLSLGRERREALASQAWQAQVPVILHAGAIPGLPGILAELLVRRFPALAELRIASTGPWRGTPGALGDVGRSKAERPLLRLPTRFRFPAPVGTLAMQPAQSADLEGFAEAHCVARLVYLEPWSALARVRLQPPRTAFCVAAEARLGSAATPADARIEVSAPDPLQPAAALAGSLAAAVLAGNVAAGLQTPREARGPAGLLSDLEKRGVALRI